MLLKETSDEKTTNPARTARGKQQDTGGAVWDNTGLETFQKCPILFKVKKGKDFNRRNT